jgi:hypothetical protein
MKLKQESLSNDFINSSFEKCPGCKANIEVFIILISIILIIYTSSPELLQLLTSNSYWNNIYSIDYKFCYFSHNRKMAMDAIIWNVRNATQISFGYV